MRRLSTKQRYCINVSMIFLLLYSGSVFAGGFKPEVEPGHSVEEECEVAPFNDPGCVSALGDVDGDGRENVADLVKGVHYVLGASLEGRYCGANLNLHADCSVDVFDLVALGEFLLDKGANKHETKEALHAADLLEVVAEENCDGPGAAEGEGEYDCPDWPHGNDDDECEEEEEDECGVCFGDNTSCADCAGTPNGDAVEDTCGICDALPDNDCVDGTCVVREDADSTFQSLSGFLESEGCAVIEIDVAVVDVIDTLEVMRSVELRGTEPSDARAELRSAGDFRLFNIVLGAEQRVVFDSLVLSQGSALGEEADGSGGALWILGESSEASVSFANVEFKDSKATQKGGAVYAKDLSVEIEHSTFHGNIARYGGAIFMQGGELKAKNGAEFYSNRGVLGGAFYLENGTDASLENTYVHGNGTPVCGDGVVDDANSFLLDLGEACDDGNSDSCDGCFSCMFEGDEDADGFYDACDECPEDPENDVDGDGLCANEDICPESEGNVVDCAGVCDGLAEEDNCGTCDANPGNDCVQDCAGEWGGSAYTDNCGICDANPGNDCVQDCAGEWGGSAYTDNCGTCDANPGNDCVQDCAGEWGGDAEVDACGVCHGDGPETESYTYTWNSGGDYSGMILMNSINDGALKGNIRATIPSSAGSILRYNTWNVVFDNNGSHPGNGTYYVEYYYWNHNRPERSIMRFSTALPGLDNVNDVCTGLPTPDTCPNGVYGAHSVTFSRSSCN